MSNWFIGLIIGSAVATSALAQQEREGDVIRKWKTGVTRTSWEPGSYDFTLSLANLNPSAAIEVKQFLIEETAEQYVSRAARREEKWVWETRSRKVCTRDDGSQFDEPGFVDPQDPPLENPYILSQTDGITDDTEAGESSEWNDFTGSRTADQLNKAIKGLGIRVAQRIVDDGTLFRSKPRTWRAFVAECQRAVDKGLMSPEVKELVTVTYGEENKKRLGLRPGQPPVPRPPVCRIIREPVRVRRYVRIPAEYSIRAGEPVTRQLNAQFVRVTIQASGNIQLLPHETEIVRVTADQNGRAHVNLVKSLNNYSVNSYNQGTDVVVTMLGQGRSANVSLPTVEELFVRTPELIQDPTNPNRIFLRLEVHPNYFNNSADQELEFSYVAYQSTGLFQYDYKKFDNYAERTVVLNKNSRVLEIDLWGAGRQR
ncbi:MAG: hypothetical protein K2X47_00300, partial [Bdellovibrionales bacterium]|nr:hypothetical protein [Bdellovibrionales bacterium]